MSQDCCTDFSGHSDRLFWQVYLLRPLCIGYVRKIPTSRCWLFHKLTMKWFTGPMVWYCASYEQPIKVRERFVFSDNCSWPPHSLMLNLNTMAATNASQENCSLHNRNTVIQPKPKGASSHSSMQVTIPVFLFLNVCQRYSCITIFPLLALSFSFWFMLPSSIFTYILVHLAV